MNPGIIKPITRKELSMKRKTIFSIVIGLVAVAMLAGLTIFLVNRQQQPQPQMESHPTQITVKQFIKEITPAAKAEQKHYHIPASIIIAQAGIESDWGRAKLAYKYNNLFGMKASGKQKRVRLYTKETINGKTKTVKQSFAVYQSWQASINAHAKLILNGTVDNHDRFKGVTKAKDYQTAAYELQKNGYATDPDYAAKLIYAIKKFKLNQYDNFNY